MVSKVKDSFHFEVFELSPLNAAAITTKGRLLRCFPGTALVVSMDIFQTPDFQTMFTGTLAKMSYQRAADTTPKVRKSGQSHDEDRDTTHPKMVTELLMGVLRSLGAPVEVSHQWKNTREEVMWQGSLLPWRRSPLWLLIRVAMQLVFARLATSPTTLEDLYKMFMAFFLSYVLELSQTHPLPNDLFYAMNAKLARRLIKLGSLAETPSFDYVRKVMMSSDKLIRARWSNVMEQAPLDVCRLKALNFPQDLAYDLPSFDEYRVALYAEEYEQHFWVPSRVQSYQT